MPRGSFKQALMSIRSRSWADGKRSRRCCATHTISRKVCVEAPRYRIDYGKKLAQLSAASTGVLRNPLRKWWRCPGLNGGPAAYESAALPTELHRHSIDFTEDLHLRRPNES